MPDVELFRDKDAATITIRVGREVATMPVGEWARLLSSPQPLPVEKALWPNGIDDLCP